MFQVFFSWTCELQLRQNYVQGGLRSARWSHATGKLDSSLRTEDDVGLCSNSPGETDIESVYSFFCESVGKTKTVIFQNSMQVDQSSSLFYTSVLLQDRVELQGMLDSGSMATTLSADVVPQLRDAGVLDQDILSSSDIVLVGCGGKQTSPDGVINLKSMGLVLVSLF